MATGPGPNMYEASTTMDNQVSHGVQSMNFLRVRAPESSLANKWPGSHSSRSDRH
jgi:hypothetical protein